MKVLDTDPRFTVKVESELTPENSLQEVSFASLFCNAGRSDALPATAHLNFFSPMVFSRFYVQDSAQTQYGFVWNERYIPLPAFARQMGSKTLPAELDTLIDESSAWLEPVQQLWEKLTQGQAEATEQYAAEDVRILCPIRQAASYRDGYAFRQHVEAARRNRNVPMIEEFDTYPIFYFTNHNAVYGPGPIRVMPDHLKQLDFELEAAVVLGRKGRNIRAEEADDYIFGYTIMNDWSARTLQMDEMKLNLGPAKGKDFATSIGPVLVTPDSLTAALVAPPHGHVGAAYDLAMKAYVNGVEVSAGNLKDMNWTFAEIIERCSYGTEVYPRDVIGSGTVGTGCFLELNGTARLANPNAQPQWLQPHDRIRLTIDRLGALDNTIELDPDSFSIIARYK